MSRSLKMANGFHRLLTVFFAVFNAVMLYLFLMWLPFGLDPLVISLQHWEDLSPRIGVVVALAAVMAVVALLAIGRLGELWKNRLTYLRAGNPHPGASAFFTTRRQPFETNDLLARFPQVKDAAFATAVQLETWDRLYDRHRDDLLVASTRVHWHLMRDLYLLATFFLLGFMVAWPLNNGIPFALASPYLFVVGAQWLFLMLSARRVGFRFADNVIATELGLKPGETAAKERKGGRR